MFGRLKNFVIGGAGPPPANEAANTPPPLGRVTLTKRKRDIDSDCQNQVNDGESTTKKQKAEISEAVVLTPVSNVALVPTTNDVDTTGSTSSRKRHHDQADDADESPSKRMKQDGNGLIERPYLDDGTEDAKDKVESVASASGHEVSLPKAGDNVLAPFDNDGASNTGMDEGDGDDEDVDVVADGLEARAVSAANNRMPDRPASLLNAARYQASTRLRHQAKRYLKQKRSEEQSDNDENALNGVDSWPGSSVVPGSISRKLMEDEAEIIDLAKRKERRVSLGNAVLALVRVK